MARFKLNPLGSLDEFRQEVDRLFDTYLGNLNPATLLCRKYPPVDMWEDSTALIVQVEVPGCPLESVELEVTGNRLRIKGFRPQPPVGNVTMHRQEQQTGDFDRMIELPVEVDPGQVDATLKDGLLTITMRKPEVAATRKIPVRAS